MADIEETIRQCADLKTLPWAKTGLKKQSDNVPTWRHYPGQRLGWRNNQTLCRPKEITPDTHRLGWSPRIVSPHQSTLEWAEKILIRRWQEQTQRQQKGKLKGTVTQKITSHTEDHITHIRSHITHRSHFTQITSHTDHITHRSHYTQKITSHTNHITHRRWLTHRRSQNYDFTIFS